MTPDQALGYVVSKLDERQRELQDFVGGGGAKDFPDYQRICGTIQGLVVAKSIMTDLVQRLEHDDDE